ncbi:MAG: hypothetical protein VXW91_04095 [Pseudomonadota bacterium]|nr:hypothetical protein [Pseudomonadota bacterium]
MALADSLRKVANKAIGKLGGDVTIQFVTLGTYNPTTGQASESTTTETIKGVVEDVSASEVNDLVRGDDKKLTIAASALTSTPGLDDKVSIGGAIHQVIRIQTVEQDNQAIVFELFLRS